MTLDLTALKAKAAEPAELVIEEGKYYQTRDGRTVGPMKRTNSTVYTWLGEAHGLGVELWTEEGRYWTSGTNDLDLVAEQPPEPTRADLCALIAEVERLREALAWQPIETAPRDAEILACGMSYGPPVRIVEWGSGRFLGRVKGREQGWRDNPGHTCEPTHWMPLPNPPIPSKDT